MSPSARNPSMGGTRGFRNLSLLSGSAVVSEAVQDKDQLTDAASADLSGTIHARAGGRPRYVWARNQYVEPVRKTL